MLYALGCYTYVCTCHAKPGGYYARVVIPIGFCIQIHRHYLGEKGTVPSRKETTQDMHIHILFIFKRGWPKTIGQCSRR